MGLDSNADAFAFGLPLALRAGNGALRLPGDLGHNLLTLAFGHVLDEPA
jgi:hypothetical protein